MKGISAIVNTLWENKVLTPSAYKNSKGLAATIVPENPYNWQSTTVALIFENVAYIGITENFKSTRLDLEKKKHIPTTKRMQTYIENSHTPLINREL